MPHRIIRIGKTLKGLGCPQEMRPITSSFCRPSGAGVLIYCVVRALRSFLTSRPATIWRPSGTGFDVPKHDSFPSHREYAQHSECRRHGPMVAGGETTGCTHTPHNLLSSGTGFDVPKRDDFLSHRKHAQHSECRRHGQMVAGGETTGCTNTPKYMRPEGARELNPVLT